MIVPSINWLDFILKKYIGYALLLLIAFVFGFPFNPKHSATNYIERFDLPIIAYPISIFVLFVLFVLMIISFSKFPRNVKKREIVIDSDKLSFGGKSINLSKLQYELRFKSNDKVDGKQIWDFIIRKPVKKSHTVILSFDEKVIFESFLKGDN